MSTKAGATVKAAVAQTINDDGTASTNIVLYDTQGLQITAAQLNNTWPAAVALPTEVASDATPGPSAFVITNVVPPAISNVVAGAFVTQTIACVTPYVAGSGQNVDFTITIASGFTGQTAPISVDGGDLSIVSDPNNPGSFAVTTTEP